jgi:hypothetical protein
MKSAQREQQSVARRPVEPLNVVDQARQRSLLGQIGQQGHDRRTHEQPLAWCGARPERRSQRTALRAG